MNIIVLEDPANYSSEHPRLENLVRRVMVRYPHVALDVVKKVQDVAPLLSPDTRIVFNHGEDAFVPREFKRFFPALVCVAYSADMPRVLTAQPGGFYASYRTFFQARGYDQLIGRSFQIEPLIQAHCLSEPFFGSEIVHELRAQ